MGILQVTNQSWLVAYYFWIPMVGELAAARTYYRAQGFTIEVIPMTQSSWEISYWYSS